MVDVVAMVVGKAICREGTSLYRLCVETSRAAIHQPYGDNLDYSRGPLVGLAAFQRFCSTRRSQMGHDGSRTCVSFATIHL